MKKNVGARRSEKRAPGDTFNRQYIHMYMFTRRSAEDVSARDGLSTAAKITQTPLVDEEEEELRQQQQQQPQE
jgi:hypothetical protein